MALFFRRPLALFCVVFTLSLLFFSHTDSAAKIVFAVLSFLLFLLFLLLRCRRKMLLLALTVAALSAQLFGYLVFDRRLLPYRTAAEAGSDVFLTATVEEITYTAAYGSAFYARVETLSGKPARGVIYVEAEEDPCVIVGSRVSFSAAVAIIDFRTEEGAYLAARGALARATVTKDVEVGAADPSLRYRIRRACTGQRTALARRLCTAVPGDTGELMAAMLLGEHSLLSPEITRNFRRVGLSHILALSGLHLGVLLSVVRWIFRRLRLPRRAEAPLSLLLLLGYLALTGFPVSVVRAGIMTGAATLAFPLRREADSITSLSLSAMLICLLRPTAVFDVGFYLTFAATLGVLVQGEGQRFFEKVPRLCASLLVTLAAILFTLPLLVWFFGEVSLVAPLTNLLFVPLFSLFLPLSLPAVLCGAPFLPAPLYAAMGDGLLFLLSRIATLRGVTVALHHPLSLPLLGICVLLLLLLLSLPRVRRRTVLFTVLGCGTAFCVCLALSVQMTLCQQDVLCQSQNGEELLLAVSDGRGLLCDLSTGATAAGKDGQDLLKDTHLTELDGYLLTHYHVRHIRLFRYYARRVVVRKVYLPVPANREEEEIRLAICREAERYGVEAVPYRPYDPISVGRLTLTPLPRGHTGSSHPAIALSVSGEGGVFTYIGSGYAASDRRAAGADWVAKSNHLFFGAHGPKSKTFPDYNVFSRHLRRAVYATTAEPPKKLRDYLTDRLEKNGDSPIRFPL